MMDISEIVGFIISLLAILFLVFRPIWEAMSKRRNPEEYAKKQKHREMQMKQAYNALYGIEDEEHEKKKHKKHKHKHHPKQEQKNHLENGHQHHLKHVQEGFVPEKHSYVQKAQSKPASYLHVRAEQPSRGSQLIRQLHSPQEMIVLQEIIGPPKSSN